MKRRVSFSKLVRRTHLFLALFLTPWVLMYALSTIAMHHRVLFTGEHNRVDPGYEVIRDGPYTPSATPTDEREAARLILRELDMEGAFTVNGSLEQGTLTIRRDRPIRSYRITYGAQPGRLRVERQRFDMAYFLEMLHRRRGYDQPFLKNDLWGLVVDGVIVSILLWAATGLWMWWEMVRTRRLGALFLGAGAVLFILFLLVL
jgi:hypothetical protein